jgi:UDP-3-O-acyl N-acetylglucosamine deacetylase
MPPPAAHIPRRTIARPVTLAGPALFTGADAEVTIHPADAGTGILLRSHHHTAALTIANLSDRPIHPVFAAVKPRCTSIRVHDQAVGTVEHICSALAGLGITDAILETNAPEIPILDGSALPFVEAILAAGRRELTAPVHPIILDRPVEIRDADASITAEPSDDAHPVDYTYTLDYGPGSPIPPGTARWTGDPHDYETGIAPARTFSSLAEAAHMQSLGLFARFTPRDLLVVGPQGPIDNAWRLPDEPARHKLLDLIGDLALLGRPLHARVHAHKTGHAHTHALVQTITQQRNIPRFPNA